LISLYEFFSQ